MPDPTLVQQLLTDTFNEGMTEGTNFTVFTFYLPQPTLAGNCLVMVIDHEYAHSVTLSDDVNGSWGAAVASVSDGSTVSTMDVFLFPNSAAGASLMTVTYSAAGTQFDRKFRAHFLEWMNVATTSPLDGHAEIEDTLTSVSTGSFTPGNSGSLIIQFANSAYGDYGYNSNVTAFSPGTNFAWLALNKQHVYAAQSLIHTSGAINPTFTTTGGSGTPMLTIAIALKAATAGNQHTGMWIRGIHHVYAPPLANPVVPIPTFGNLLVITTTIAQAGDTITSVTDGTNTYSAPTLDSTAAQLFYAQNSTPSTNRSVTLNGWDAGLAKNVHFYDIMGAATSAFDTSGSSEDATTPNANTPTLTPTTSTGIVVAAVVYGVGPPTAVNYGTFDCIMYAGKTDAGTEQGDGVAHYIDAPASTLNYIWTSTNAGSGTAAAFKAPAGGAPARKDLLLLGVGQ